MFDIGVYQILNAVNGKRYIGSAADRGIKKRWHDHKEQLRKQKHHSRYLQYSWNKYGQDAFVFEVLLYCDPRGCLFYEQLVMDHYQPEYNMTPTAGSQFGYRHTPEGRRKSAANREYKRGSQNSWYGRKHSEESKRKISQNNGRGNLGKKLTQKERAKLSEVRCGKGGILDEQRVMLAKFLLKNNVNYREVASLLGVARQTISDILHDRTWRHVRTPRGAS